MGESESVKERVNEAVFKSWWPEFLSVSFSTLTTAEEPKSLKCIWNKTCIYFPLNISGCKTQTIPRPCNKYQVYTLERCTGDYISGTLQNRHVAAFFTKKMSKIDMSTRI